MAQTEQQLTTEEKIVKLRQHDNWWAFTNPQRAFLTYVAEGLTVIEAAKKAYPDCKSHVVMTKSLLARVGIQSALESIGLGTARPNISKSEALKQLSRFMRNAKDATEYCKLLSLYSKLSGWDEEEEEPGEEVSLDKLVAAMEKKRKAKA